MAKKHNSKYFIKLLVIIILSLCGLKVLSYSTYDLYLKNSYQIYKKTFLSNDGRVIDYDRNDITTTEGQSYMLLRSYLMNDKKTFDIVLTWTNNNLRRSDGLYSWLWGKNNATGQWEILDENTATDAGIDIGLALFKAYEKWKDPKYKDMGLKLVKTIGKTELKQVGDYVILMPGLLQSRQAKIEVNPSYFSPYAFKVFAKYDKSNDWIKVTNSSYQLLSEVMKPLPPNWFYLENNKIVLASGQKSNFSYDAIRVFPRIYLDYKMTKDKRALTLIKKSNFFLNRWRNKNVLYTNFNKKLVPSDNVQYSGSIACILPAINVLNPKEALRIFNLKLKPLFENKEYLTQRAGYYEKNLIWFGLYLYKE